MEGRKKSFHICKKDGGEIQMQNEAIALSIKFFAEIKGFSQDGQGKVIAKDEYKMKIMNDLISLLAGGTPAEKIEKILEDYKKLHVNPQDAYSIDDILSFLQIRLPKGQVKDDPDNILERGKFYYHPRLQQSPPPPTIELMEDGTFKRSYDEEKFFLEVKEKFTIDDLIDYFYETMDIQVETYRRRDKGAFEHLLRNYDIDILMFTIGEASFMSEDLNKRKPRHPFDIEEYVEDGISLMDERKNTLYMEGLDRVIPR